MCKTIAPSAVPLNIGDSWIASVARSLIFGTPKAMTGDQIENVIAQFTRAARLAFQAGFDGVEIHAGRE
jgi:2,4-dienoyl-CoA reductase-like NADH-dependent reductase (Old Yellow Enzyme family)